MNYVEIVKVEKIIPIISELTVAFTFNSREHSTQLIKRPQKFHKERDGISANVILSSWHNYYYVTGGKDRLSKDRLAGNRDLAGVITYNNSYLIVRKSSFLRDITSRARCSQPRRQRQKCCHCCPLRAMLPGYCARNFIVRVGFPQREKQTERDRERERGNRIAIYFFHCL